MKKRIISLMLLTSLLATTLVGCGNDKDNTPVSDDKESVENTDNAEESGEEVEEPVTVSWLGVDRSSDGVIPSDDPEKGWKNSAAGKVLVEDLAEMNIELDIKYVMFDNNTYKATISNRIGTGVDLADIVYMESYEDNVRTWGNYGFVLDILPLLEQYDEDGSIKQFFYDHGAGNVWENAIDDDGHMYYLPNINQNPVAVTDKGVETKILGGAGFCIRKDWVEALGYECKEIYTPDEILDLVVEMREKDVNGDGKKNEHIYSKILNSDYAGITRAFRLDPYGIGYYTDFEEKTVKVINSFESEYFDDFVDWIQRAIDAGVYNPDYLAGIFDRDLYSCAVGFENGHSGPGYGYGEGFGDLSYTLFDYVPIIIDVEGSAEGAQSMLNGVVPQSNQNILISAVCKNPEPVIRLLDYMYTDEFAYLACHGVEGKGYEVNPDGTIKSLSDRNSIESMLETLGLGDMGMMVFPWNFGAIPYGWKTDYSDVEFVQENSATWSPEIREDMAQRNIKNVNEYFPKGYHSVQIWPAKSAEDNDYLTIYGAQLSTAMSEYISQFLLGKLSVEDDLDDVVNELYDSYNMQGVIDANLNTLKKKYTVVE